MKKLITLLTAGAVLLSGIIFTSCGAAETIKEIVDSTHQKWYKYNGSASVSVSVRNITPPQSGCHIWNPTGSSASW